MTAKDETESDKGTEDSETHVLLPACVLTGPCGLLSLCSDEFAPPSSIFIKTIINI